MEQTMVSIMGDGAGPFLFVFGRHQMGIQSRFGRQGAAFEAEGGFDLGVQRRGVV